jgi:tetratricopeptide (TPR) repeat protein
MRTLAILVAMLLTCVAYAQAPGTSLKPEARAHYRRGLELYQHGQFDAAISELREGLAIDPQPELLYALGQAERKSGHCDRAVEHFQACLALLKDPAAQAAVRVQIERCAVEQKEEPKPGPEARPQPLPEELPEIQWPEPAPAPPPKRSSWIRDPLGGVLTTIGLAGVATGGALIGVARDEGAHAGDSYQRFADAQNAMSLWTGGVVSLSVGGALILGGIVRYAVVARRSRR